MLVLFLWIIANKFVSVVYQDTPLHSLTKEEKTKETHV